MTAAGTKKKPPEIAAFDLERTYVGLDGKGGAAKLPVGPDFWATIDRNPAARGTLVTVHESDADWPHWEVHPKGDEVVCMLEGAATMVFEREGGDERVSLTPGRAVIVPAGVWHRATVRKRCRMLFMTYGEGTEHKPLAKARRR